ncbi:MAG: prepilin-type N-terminal cleavage/methylation domain-containing protein, partial [Cyanobium sp.]
MVVPTRGPQAGFSLVELLVSLLLAGVVSGALLQAL